MAASGLSKEVGEYWSDYLRTHANPTWEDFKLFAERLLPRRTDRIRQTLQDNMRHYAKKFNLPEEYIRAFRHIIDNADNPGSD